MAPVNYLLLLLLFIPSFSYGLHRCFTTHCPGDDPVCIQLCPTGINTCHAVRQTLTNTHAPIELGCTNTTSGMCSSSLCNFNPIHTLQTLEYCCCNDDLCNRISGVTDPIDPILTHTTVSPTAPPPDKDTLICELYQCDMDRSYCIHSYEICADTPPGEMSSSHDHACRAVYQMNPATKKIELRDSGCIYTQLTQPPSMTPCNLTTSCHVDNPLSPSPDTPYYCCCGESLCNANQTFTHPTEVSSYGLEECNNAECTYSCVIRNHTATCFCPNGYALFNKTQCVDIDECLIDNGGCEEACINTRGSFNCDCEPGRSINSVTKRCEDDDGIVCGSLNCQGSYDAECPLEIDFCPTSTETPDDLKPLYHLHYCQAVYVLVNGTFIPRRSSCFAGSHTNCDNNNCVLTSSSFQGLYHCCCYGDLCNANDSLIFPSIETSTPSSTSSPSSSSSSFSSPSSEYLSSSFTLFLSSSPDPSVETTTDTVSSQVIYPAIFGSLIFFMLVLFLMICLCLIFTHYFFKRKVAHEEALAAAVTNRTPSPLFCIEPQFIKVIGHGRFAEVYHAKLNNEDVAIKIFNNTLPARGSWTQEKDIYMTETLAHDNILRFIGHDNRIHEGRNTFWLIFDYHHNGSLYDYLQTHRITLDELCSLSMSASHGLAHLHSDHTCIAHRDLKSKNILVKKDMTCCISDFGLAVRFADDYNTIAETKGQVGTSRYMAPEVLQGAIIFNQISFLRIDVYAFGLILWEMASSCDLENNCSSVPNYHPPFDGMVSSNPSIEEMKRAVVDKKLRPEIPQDFKTNSSYTPIAEIITECLDGEGGARPSAQLIKRRLDQFHSNNFSSSSLTNIPSKESGFLSMGTHPGPPTNSDHHSFNGSLPPTPTPSYSPTSITMSPTELKSSHKTTYNLCHVYPSSLPSSPQRQGLVLKTNGGLGGESGRANHRPTNLGFMPSFATSPDDNSVFKMSCAVNDGETPSAEANSNETAV